MAQPNQSLPTTDPKALKIMAKSLYRQLREGGYSQGDVLGFASELLSMVSHEVRERQPVSAANDSTRSS